MNEFRIKEVAWVTGIGILSYIVVGQLVSGVLTWRVFDSYYSFGNWPSFLFTFTSLIALVYFLRTLIQDSDRKWTRSILAIGLIGVVFSLSSISHFISTVGHDLDLEAMQSGWTEYPPLVTEPIEIVADYSNMPEFSRGILSPFARSIPFIQLALLLILTWNGIRLGKSLELNEKSA